MHDRGFLFSLPLLLSAAAGLLATGCGGGGKTVPVSGKVTVSGKPLSKGTVQLWPDQTKGNTSPLEAVGDIQEDGSYSLSTRGQLGVAPGAYKALVFSSVPIDPKDPYSETRSLVNPQYGSKEDTPLAITVVSNPAPGAYDLKLEP